MPTNKAKSFVVIMVVIAALAVLLRIAAEQIIKVNIAQNESDAAATLKLIAAALQNYAQANKGLFPDKFEALVKTAPPYLDKDYTELPSLKGYDYICQRLEPLGYSCSAVPAKCGISGNIIYTVSSGGISLSEACDKKGAE